MQLSDYTRALLDDIERRIDPETEEDFIGQWRDFWFTDLDTPRFLPIRKKISPPGIQPKKILINDAISDFELMLDSQLAGVSHALAGQTSALNIRANYGTGILSSLFGAEIFMMPYNTDTLPTTRSIHDSDKIRALVDVGVPSLRGGFGANVFTFAERCREIFESYPKIRRYVDIYHPDTQGPLDIAELLWGDEMFYEMYDDPDFVHSFLRVITDTYKTFLDAWYRLVPLRGELSCDGGVMYRGTILLRLDSGMNISDDFYREFSLPYDREVFDHFGGGALHFCGRGDHYIRSVCEIENLYGFNLSQPHLNDMDIIFDAAASTGKRILRLPDAALYAARPDIKRGMIHG